MTKRVIVLGTRADLRNRVVGNRDQVTIWFDDQSVTIPGWEARNLLKREAHRHRDGDGNVLDTNVSEDVWFRALERFIGSET